MIHVNATHKVVAVPATPELRGLFENARVFDYKGEDHLVLPHGFHETVVLRNMGVPVPAPILSQYAFPHPPGQPPFHAQKQTAALFTTNQRAYCLNGMGTGKTRSAIWAFDYLRSIGLAKRCLVSCPMSIMDRTWRSEIFRLCPHLKVSVLYGTKKQRLKALAQPADVYIINRDGLMVIGDDLIARPDIDTLVIDELADFRNAGSERNKMLRKIVAGRVWAWGMTGSPTPRQPTDVWGQCRVLTPSTVPKYFGHFRDQLMVKVDQFTYVPRMDATEQAYHVMQPAVRFTLDDVTELPDVIEETIDIPMTGKQAEVYEKMRLHAFVEEGGMEITAVNAGALLNKLRQVSLGYVYAGDRGVVDLGAKARLERLVEDIDANDQKCIIFVPYTHALRAVHAYLAKEGIDVTPAIDGSTPKRIRDETFRLFQETTKHKVLVAHPVCMAHGLTLTRANMIGWYGPPDSLETFEQANARIRRVGQKHKQRVLMYQSSPAERKMYKRLRQKQSVQDKLLEMFEASTD